MKNLRLFETESQYETAKWGFKYPTMSYVTDTGVVHYMTLREKYTNEYLTFEALESGTFTLTIAKNDYGGTLGITSISYSIDNGNNWVTTQRSSNTITIITTPMIQQGGKVLWKGIASSLYVPAGPGVTSIFSSTGKFNAYGNIMSLLYGDNFEDKTTFPSTEGKFGCVFENAVNLINVENLILPVTTLTSFCYNGMFEGCTSLTTAPELPATTLESGCYTNMFWGCSSLTTAPELPATTLASSCYNSMFSGCILLTTAPELPATTLKESCYDSMFSGCTLLTTATELPATTLASNCYKSMFYGCTSLTTAPELPATTLVNGCYRNMFDGCTSLTTAPELPATTLATYCYYQMFYGCSSLNYIKAMFTTTPSPTYTSSWVYGVASTGTFVKNSAATWNVTGVNGVPTGWTVTTASA